MLFLTTFLAILLAGGVTFLVGGLGRLTTAEEHRRMRRSSFALIVCATVLVAIPLSATTWRSIDRSIETQAATGTVEEWLEGTTYEVVTVNVGDPDVFAEIAGHGVMNPAAALADSLELVLERPVRLRLEVMPAHLQESARAQMP